MSAFEGHERRAGWAPSEGTPPRAYQGPERRAGYPPASKQEVADMRLAQEALDRSVRGLHSQLRSLDATLRDFVPRRELEETTRRTVATNARESAADRRAVAALLAGGIVVAIQAHDLHVEECRPISEDGTLGRPDSELGRFVCDVGFPYERSPDGVDFSSADLLGGFLYAVFFAWVIRELVLYRRRKGH